MVQGDGGRQVADERAAHHPRCLSEQQRPECLNTWKYITEVRHGVRRRIVMYIMTYIVRHEAQPPRRTASSNLPPSIHSPATITHLDDAVGPCKLLQREEALSHGKLQLCKVLGQLELPPRPEGAHLKREE